MDCEKGERKLTQQEKDKFIQDITPLIYLFAKKGFKAYRGSLQFSDEIREEMLSAARLGAAKAAHYYVSGSTAKPSTFAHKFIWCEVMNAMRYMASLGLAPLNPSKVQKRPNVYGSSIPLGLNESPVVLCYDDHSFGEHGIEWALAIIDDERDREIVKLRLVDDLTFDEIGDVFGFNKNNARALFNKTINRIRLAVIEEHADGRSARCRRLLADRQMKE